MDSRSREAGNAFIYILIAVVLFAALSFIMARQEDSREAQVLSPESAKLMATQLINSATQIKGAVDQMLFAGTVADELDFVKPGAAGYDAPDVVDNMHKVFHPDGGGVTLQGLPANAIDADADAAPAWYLGRYNSVAWTPSVTHDVVLAAYGIDRQVCAAINQVLTGAASIPQMTVATKDIFIDNGSQTNADLMAVNCGACVGQASLCVSDSGGNYTFYNVLVAE